MTRLLGLVVISLASLFTMAGCGSDPREGLLTTTIENMRTAATQVGNIREKITQMVKKAEDEQVAPDTKPVVDAIKSLRDVAKDLQKLNLKAEKTAQEPLSKEDRARLEKKYQDKVNEAMSQLTKEQSKLEETLTKAEAKYKDVARDLRKQIESAQGEYQAVARAAERS